MLEFLLYVLTALVALPLLAWVYFEIQAVVVAVASLFFMDSGWTVDSGKPLSKDSQRAILRKVEPLELLVIGRGGKPSFPVIQQSSARLIVSGLKDGSGMKKRSDINDWDIESVPEKEEMPDVIQSSWGFLSPIYTLRYLTFLFTGRHVVRIKVPFFVKGAVLYEPIMMRFVRARPKGVKIEDPMLVIERVPEKGEKERDTSMVHLVQDTTDHLLWQSPIRFLTDTIPTRSGLSIRADVTLAIEVANLHKVVGWKDWSSQILSVVSNASSKYFRGGELSEVYATIKEANSDRKEDDPGDRLQRLIASYLTDKDVYCFKEEKGSKQSVFDVLGLKLLNVTLNDLVPADEDTEAEINRIMAILAEGERNATVAGRLLQEQLAAMEGVDPVVAQALGAITAAQKAGQAGKIDYLIGGGGPVTFDQGLLNKIAKSQNGGGK